MSQKKNKVLFVLFILFSLSKALLAQSSSPYNLYGVGTFYPGAISGSRAMGGVSAAYANRFGINLLNPASLSELALTTFDAGMEGESVRTLGRDSMYKAGSSGFSHFALAFPVMRGRWGLALSFKPYSSVKYNFKRTNYSSQVGEYAELNTGSGNTYQFMIGNGVHFKGFSIGANLGVMFGHFDYSKTTVIKNDAYALPTRLSNELTLRGFIYNVGAQYKFRLPIKNKAKNIFATVGAYGSSDNQQQATLINHWERFDISGTAIEIVDTVDGVRVTKGNVNLPGNICAGFAFEQTDKWFVGTDLKYTNGKSYSSVLNNGSLSNSLRWSVGGEICPDKTAKKNVFNYMVYRAGFYTGTSTLNINGIQLKETGATVGFGVPLRLKDGSQFSMFNFAFEFETRGARSSTLLRENYYKFNLSFVFNDRWFLKRRFD